MRGPVFALAPFLCCQSLTVRSSARCAGSASSRSDWRIASLVDQTPWPPCQRGAPAASSGARVALLRGLGHRRRIRLAGGVIGGVLRLAGRKDARRARRAGRDDDPRPGWPFPLSDPGPPPMPQVRLEDDLAAMRDALSGQPPLWCAQIA